MLWPMWYGSFPKKRSSKNRTAIFETGGRRTGFIIPDRLTVSQRTKIRKREPYLKRAFLTTERAFVIFIGFLKPKPGPSS
jgi:hypothetical protein